MMKYHWNLSASIAISNATCQCISDIQCIMNTKRSLAMSSSDSSDGDPFEFVPHESLKESTAILHTGACPKNPSPFATTGKQISWPDKLWYTGTLVYDIKQPKLVPPADSLIFNSKFESGNLQKAFLLSGNSYHLILEYDQNKSGSCQWFYFQMKNVKADVKYHFYISGFHKASGVFKMGSKVFWYSEQQAQKDGIGWKRGGSNYGYQTTDDADRRATLQFHIKFPYEGDTVYMCYSLPYTYTDLLRYIESWKREKPDCVRCETLCKTLGGRDCPVLTLTSPGDSRSRKCVFLTGRIHPGESPGSVVLHGFLDFLVSNHSAANYILNNYIVKVVPMVNIDGVIEGFYRIGLSGVDLNRIWTNPDPYLHPVVTKTKELIKEMQEERGIAVYLDFHGHSRLNGTFLFGCPNSDDKDLRNCERHLPRIISFLSDAFSWKNCVFSIPKERKSASRIVVRQELGVVQSFTLESSFGGIGNGPRSGILYDELLWKELGAKCGEAVYHLLVGRESPLASYVGKEVDLMSPPPSEDREEAYQERSLTISNHTEETKHEIEVGLMMGRRIRGQPTALLSVRQPHSFLMANSRIISTESPGYVAPKWKQLELTLQ